jgi:cardiolipin synthase
MGLTLFHFIALGSVLLLCAFLYVVLFEPRLSYEIDAELPPTNSHQFLGLLAALVDAAVLEHSRVDALTNGSEFYEAELKAIGAASHSVHLEAFIFLPSPIADQFLQVLTERAQSGVKVRLVVDAIGSMETSDDYFDGLRAAGGDLRWYQPIRWHTLKRFNNRTHRELIIVDGEVGFIGGAGMAAWWTKGTADGPAWRDTMVRVSGPLAAALQSSFVENWLESTGEILAHPGDYPYCRAEHLESLPGDIRGIVVTSAPSAGRATRARILFQTLLAGARDTIHINSPYFLADTGIIRELAHAVERGVKVEVIVPGIHNNHPIARRASRRRYGELLQAGIRIFEYSPGMMHAKILLVDHIWSVVGSTNFDNRSFGLNDEVNLAVQDQGLTERLEFDFQKDLLTTREITLPEWRQRPYSERLLAGLGTVLERHQ